MAAAVTSLLPISEICKVQFLVLGAAGEKYSQQHGQSIQLGI